MNIFSFFFAIFIFHSAYSQNSSGFTEREKTQQSIEQNRKELNQYDTTTFNSSSKPSVLNLPNFESNATYEMDHRSIVYSSIFEKDRIMNGWKLTGAVAFGFYKDPESERFRLIAGVELPGDYITRSLIYYVGGGFQLGRKSEASGLYLIGGLDHRLMSWFKLQYGLNWVLGASIGGTLSAGITF